MIEDLSQSRVLIVDDTRLNIAILVDALKGEYKLSTALSGIKALEYLEHHLPDLILLDIMMPGMDGYEVCARLKGSDRTKGIPIIFITAVNDLNHKTRGFELGAVDYITKPFEILEVKARVRTHLALKHSRESLENYNSRLEEKIRERTKELHDTQLEIVCRLGRAAEYRDNETGLHIKRMSHYCRLIAQQLGLGHEEVELIYRASPMHDIGKIGIPDRILLKPGHLTQEEMDMMKTHTTIGAEILSGHHSKLLHMAQTIALSHHEHWDGRGYPQGLSGEAIPLAGRIAGLCDVFDALTSRRPYKEPWPLEKALEFIKGERGLHFDPQLVELFLEKIPDVLQIRDRFTEGREHSHSNGKGMN